MYTFGIILLTLGIIGIALVKIFWSDGGFFARSEYKDYLVPVLVAVVGLILSISYY